MKTIAMLALATISAAGNQPGVQTWRWETETPEGRDVPEESLIVETIRTGNRIRGQACYIYAFGNRIDCPVDDCNISGTIEEGGAAELVVRSEYFDKDMAVRAKFGHDSLDWWSEEYGPDRKRFVRLKRGPAASTNDLREVCSEHTHQDDGA